MEITSKQFILGKVALLMGSQGCISEFPSADQEVHMLAS